MDERSRPFPQIPSRWIPRWLRSKALVWLPAYWGWDNQKWREHDSWFLGWIAAYNWQIGLRRKVGHFWVPVLSIWVGGRFRRHWHFYFPFPARMLTYFGYELHRRRLMRQEIRRRMKLLQNARYVEWTGE